MNLEDQIENIEADLSVVQSDLAAVRDTTQNQLLAVRTDIVEVKELVLAQAQAAAAGQAECQAKLAALSEKLSLRLKIGTVVKALGTFLGGAAVVLVPAQADKVAAVLTKLLEAMP